MDLLIIGEAPVAGPVGALPALAPEGRSGRRLAALVGVASILDVAATVNLLDAPVSGWPTAEARLRADRLLVTRPERRWVLCGGRVAAAVSLKAPWMTWAPHRGRLMAVLPHPSGLSRWWNDPAHVAAASAFLAEATDPARWVAA